MKLKYNVLKFQQVLFILPLVWLTGCAAMGSRLEPPRVSLAAMRVQEIQAFETVFEVDLRVFNRNDKPLSISGIDCSLELNGRHLAQGVADPQKTIEPYAADTVSVTVYASVVDMVIAGHHLLKGDGAATTRSMWDYALKGHLRLGEADGFGTRLPFESRGRIDLSSLRSPSK